MVSVSDTSKTLILCSVDSYWEDIRMSRRKVVTTFEKAVTGFPIVLTSF